MINVKVKTPEAFAGNVTIDLCKQFENTNILSTEAVRCKPKGMIWWLCRFNRAFSLRIASFGWQAQVQRNILAGIDTF